MNLQTRALILLFLLCATPAVLVAQPGASFKIVDTKQTLCYSNTAVIPAPSAGQAFYGQDANYSGNAPSYVDNGDGTVTDMVTGLMWQKSPDVDGNGVINYSDKMFSDRALTYADSFRLGGYTDWRLPSIKEMYSLILYNGAEPNPNGTTGAYPFIDTTYFKFAYGDLSAGDRIIDAQYASSTIYVSTTMNGNRTMFGVNFADGRIKGYPATTSSGKKYYVRYVRGNTSYGRNQFVDNHDGTITDNATGLTWMKNDNGSGITWEHALSYAESFAYAGHTDWRLPNAKELQSIVDYTRSPSTTQSAAIDSVFNCTPMVNEANQADYPFYWTGTTFSSLTPSNAPWAVYVCFGRAMGCMTALGGWIDVHGAGAQRSDPKVGDPSTYPCGHGPQGDAVRIYNFARLVRGGIATTDVQQSSSDLPDDFVLQQNYPNPFNPSTRIRFKVPIRNHVSLRVYDVLGREMATLVDEVRDAGTYEEVVDSRSLASGVYFYRMQAGPFIQTKRLAVLK